MTPHSHSVSSATHTPSGPPLCAAHSAHSVVTPQMFSSAQHFTLLTPYVSACCLFGRCEAEVYYPQYQLAPEGDIFAQLDDLEQVSVNYSVHCLTAAVRCQCVSVYPCYFTTPVYLYTLLQSHCPSALQFTPVAQSQIAISLLQSELYFLSVLHCFTGSTLLGVLLSTQPLRCTVSHFSYALLPLALEQLLAGRRTSCGAHNHTSSASC